MSRRAVAAATTCAVLLVVATGAMSFPCPDYGSDVFGEIACLRRHLRQCTAERNRGVRTVPTPASSFSILTTTTHRPATTSLPLWNDDALESSGDWPTPNAGLIIDALKYELAKDIETKLREANANFEGKMSTYQAEMETRLKKLAKDLRLLKLKVHRRGTDEYIVSEHKESWYTASEICTEWGGHLVSVRDADENAYVAGLLPSPSDSAWIGLNDVQREETFVNVDGVITTYRNWEADQPDNMHYNENCVDVRGSNGQWRDSLCLLTKRFICRRSQ